MNAAKSQFETGRMEVHKQDFHRPGTYRSDISSYTRRSKNFEFTNSVETTENNEGFEFRIPLSEVSIENLEIIPKMNYLIVKSNKKTIFIKLSREIKLNKFSSIIKSGMLIIRVKK